MWEWQPGAMYDHTVCRGGHEATGMVPGSEPVLGCTMPRRTCLSHCSQSWLYLCDGQHELPSRSGWPPLTTVTVTWQTR